MGYENGDDAAVFTVPKNKAVVQTLDFFTPMVDDPYVFGQITAANALSDIYAMGGEPVYALNIVGFPICSLPKEILKGILQGAADKLTEAGVTIIGGHSIDDPQPKYGLSVSGFINPHEIWQNDKCLQGQDIILTKPLGTGIITTAIKGDMAHESAIIKATHVMTTLNKGAKETIEKYGITCCTDITGFGLVGHSLEIAKASKLDMVFDHKRIPFIEEAKEYASMGLIPAGAYRNRDYFADSLEIDKDIPQYIVDIIHDPQTSGGLLFSCAPNLTNEILAKLNESGFTSASIGKTQKGTGKLFII